LYDLPDYVSSCILIDKGVSFPFLRVVDDLVYLYGSTCANDVGLTMTLAHEIQHAIQHAKMREVWAVNGLLPQLTRDFVSAKCRQLSVLGFTRGSLGSSRTTMVRLPN
jgi:hypothetical protein